MPEQTASVVTDATIQELSDKGLHWMLFCQVFWNIQTLGFYNTCSNCLTLKEPSKLQQTTLLVFFYFYLSKKIRHDVSCESSA